MLDPCCGTGAYLVEVLHRIQRTLREQAGEDDALVGCDLRRAATTRIFDFEIMRAPYVISHLQIAQLLEDANASLSANQRAQVFLTNALTGWLPTKHPQSNSATPPSPKSATKPRPSIRPIPSSSSSETHHTTATRASRK